MKEVLKGSKEMRRVIKGDYISVPFGRCRAFDDYLYRILSPAMMFGMDMANLMNEVAKPAFVFRFEAYSL